MTVYNVTKTFNKGFVNALKAYLDCSKLEIRYSDWLNDINIFTYNSDTDLIKNKKELCLKRIKQYIRQFENDKGFEGCPIINHDGLINKHNVNGIVK